MTPERWQIVKDVCQLALERDPGHRDAFLVDACGDDDELRRDVESLIEELTSSGILTQPIWQPNWQPKNDPDQFGIRAEPASRDPWLQKIGQYRIIGLVGEGGMGTVFEAQQDHPFRTVAIKVIKQGLSSPQILKRFKRESEALSRLEHPGIAQIYEAGAEITAFGIQPYLAMEFIRGETLKEYSQSHSLSTRERLEIAVQICDAIEHAHQRGLIHRDLKPGNIMVDGNGRPKVLDFGVARLIDIDAQATRITVAGQMVGTLAYMSPEQVLADPVEVDKRTDVYSLGLIIYELLADRPAYVIGKHFAKALNTIREQVPARLSSISADYLGEIERIVAKALEKNKNDRYDSPAALAEDLRRHLPRI